MVRKLMMGLAAGIVVMGLVGCAGADATTSAPPQPTTAEHVEATQPATATDAGSIDAAPATSDATEAGVETAPVTCTKLNLNEVTGEQLLALIPGFSDRMVREFQEYRPYVSIQQFRREIGKYVDEATVAGYEQYVYVPVDPNNADADTLMQIPGVDQAAADALIAARPFASTQAFVDALAASGVDTAAASCFVAAQ